MYSTAIHRASAWFVDVDVVWMRSFGMCPTSSGHVFGSMLAKNDVSLWGMDATRCTSVRARTVQ